MLVGKSDLYHRPHTAPYTIPIKHRFRNAKQSAHPTARAILLATASSHYPYSMPLLHLPHRPSTRHSPQPVIPQTTHSNLSHSSPPKILPGILHGNLKEGSPLYTKLCSHVKASSNPRWTVDCDTVGSSDRPLPKCGTTENRRMSDGGGVLSSLVE